MNQIHNYNNAEWVLSLDKGVTGYWFRAPSPYESLKAVGIPWNMPIWNKARWTVLLREHNRRCGGVRRPRAPHYWYGFPTVNFSYFANTITWRKHLLALTSGSNTAPSVKEAPLWPWPTLGISNLPKFNILLLSSDLICTQWKIRQLSLFPQCRNILYCRRHLLQTAFQKYYNATV